MTRKPVEPDFKEDLTLYLVDGKFQTGDNDYCFDDTITAEQLLLELQRLNTEYTDVRLTIYDDYGGGYFCVFAQRKFSEQEKAELIAKYRRDLVEWEQTQALAAVKRRQTLDARRHETLKKLKEKISSLEIKLGRDVC